MEERSVSVSGETTAELPHRNRSFESLPSQSDNQHHFQQQRQFQESPSSTSDTYARETDSLGRQWRHKEQKIIIEQHESMNDMQSSSNDSRFDCNICLEAVVEPVVTLCGHLYCWPCLYRWLEPGFSADEKEYILLNCGIAQGRERWQTSRGNPSRRCCPVCKKECRVCDLVPIYVRNEPSSRGSHRTRTRTQYINNQLNSENDGNSEQVGAEGAGSFIGNVDMGLRRRRYSINTNATEESFTGNGNAQTGMAATTAPNMTLIRNDMSTISVPARPSRPPILSNSSLSEGLHEQNCGNVLSQRNNSATTNISQSTATSISSHQPFSPALFGLQHLVQNSTRETGASSERERMRTSSATPTTVNTDRSGNREQRQNGLSPLYIHHDYELDSEVESATTEFLSRLLLMLGSFVVFCLLLF
mmetsp:Transcript_28927/g.42893  ORF Transcript_28927/g.42893 Transcript_28927/m.42893 type:complete len:418 (-) Transcript_28927:401-1654(-)|eukprot:CAMPEP_0195511380 /NCGR_PEP_ID=MMETSP0794_2-20130614/3718_1 /TAXON_ID=515487 /ORGANISM="Stephanopyxis turris, Strain CCMP 815" /LENGTH=417 /DNA_ID=CAMNT_0040638963 /DNA_START=58 /DNA_END=1311 /DNA_ORIENTATION=+